MAPTEVPSFVHVQIPLFACDRCAEGAGLAGLSRDATLPSRPCPPSWLCQSVVGGHLSRFRDFSVPFRY